MTALTTKHYTFAFWTALLTTLLIGLGRFLHPATFTINTFYVVGLITSTLAVTMLNFQSNK